MHGGGKNLQIFAEIAVYFGNGTKQAHSYYGSLMGSHRNDLCSLKRRDAILAKFLPADLRTSYAYHRLTDQIRHGKTYAGGGGRVSSRSAMPIPSDGAPASLIFGIPYTGAQTV